MNALSIPVVAMASISFYVGFYHLLIYFRRRQFREDLTFAFLCFVYVFYAAFCVGLYNATSVIEGAQWQRAQFIALAVLVPAFLWFVSDYTRQNPGPVIYIYSILYLLVIFVQLVDRSDLTFLMDQPSVKQIMLSEILTFTYYEVTPGPFSVIQGIVGLIASTYILIMGIRYFKRGHKREAKPLILATGFIYAAAFNDTMVSNNLYDFVYLMEYAYLGIIVVMAYSLSNTVIEAAITKDALRESERKFRLFVEQSSVGLVFTDEEGCIIEWNSAQERLTGITRGESIGQPLWEIQPKMLADPMQSPEAIQRLKQVVELALQSGQAGFLDKPIEVELSRRDGTKIYIEQIAFSIKTKQGYRLGSISRDITQLKRAEDELVASEEKYRRLVEVSPIPMWINEDGIITYLNPAAMEALGASHPEQVIGKEATDFIHPDYHTVVLRRISKITTEEIVAPLLEEKYVRLDGSVIDVEVTATEFHTSAGSHVGQVFFQNITERKQAETERENLIQELTDKNMELERFTYTVSHDLKSPLITIAGFLGYLEQDAISGDIDRLQRDIQRIQNAVKKMERLLNELLELSRIGRLMNPPEMIPFEEVVQEALDITHGQLKDRGIAVKLAPNLPAVYGDRQRLIEVLQNLIDNAVKFMGDQPGPRIEIGQDRQEDDMPVFFVRDNGIGIAPEYHERVFGLFDKLNAKSDGTALVWPW